MSYPSKDPEDIAADKAENTAWWKAVGVIACIACVLIVAIYFGPKIYHRGKDRLAVPTSNRTPYTKRPPAKQPPIIAKQDLPEATATPVPTPLKTTPKPATPAPATQKPPVELPANVSVNSVANQTYPDFHPGDTVEVTIPIPKLNKAGTEIGTAMLPVSMIVRVCNDSRLQLFASPTGKYGDWTEELDWMYGKKENTSGTYTMRNKDGKKSVITKGNFQVAFVQLPGQSEQSKTKMKGWLQYTELFKKDQRPMSLKLASRASVNPNEKTALNTK